MSEKIIDTFIAERLQKVWGSKETDKLFREISRDYTNNKGSHFFTITSAHIRNILQKGLAQAQSSLEAKDKNLTDAARRRRRAELDKIYSKYKPAIKKIAPKVVEGVSEHYKNNREVQHKGSGPGYVKLLTLDKNRQWRIKETIFNVIEQEIKKFKVTGSSGVALKKELFGEDGVRTRLFNKIKEDTQFLHRGEETVGISSAEILYGKNLQSFTDKDEKEIIGLNAIEEDSALGKTIDSWYFNSESRKKAEELLREALREIIPKDLSVVWKLDDSKDHSKRKVVVKGEFNSRRENYAGSEAYDWVLLRQSLIPKLQAKLDKLLEGDALKKLATMEGSQPFDKRLGLVIVNKAINKLVSSKRVKTKKPSIDKPKNYNKKSKGLQKQTKKHINPVNTKVSDINVPKLPALPRIKQQPTLNLNALKAQINARLSMTVIKNMGTPALENRTGRFARSVLVTDVTQTSKGFPSIGYTYQKYPYQTFEPGFKQGSAQRDPRTLIDRSIREIASELLIGRFYTRRV